MRKISALPGLVFFVIVAIGLAFAYLEYNRSAYGESLSIALGAFAIALVASYSIKIADQWDRAVVLRLGRFRSLEGPGLFFIIPIIETVPYWIDTRVITSSFKAEKTLTKDTVRWISMPCCFGKSWTQKGRRSTLPTMAAPLAGLPKRLCVT